MKISNLLASGLGIGYSSHAPGTLGTLLGIPFFYFFSNKPMILILLTCILFFIGVYVSGKTALNENKKDPSFIVIDEIVGFMIACLFIKFNLLNLIIIFVFFRFFDILKPFPIKKIEKFPGGWGIMLDDIMAGVYANLLFQLIFLWKNLF